MSNNQKSVPAQPKRPTRDLVRNWLKKHGAPLEMRVARQLDELGFSVEQSLYWLDEESRKSLEIDMRLRFTLVNNPGRSIADLFVRRDIEVEYLIECKVVTEHPWVIFKRGDAPGLEDWRRTYGLIASENSDPFLDRIFSAPMDTKPTSLARAYGINGYGVTVHEGKSQDKGQTDGVGDLAYRTLKKISKAAKYFAGSDQSWQKPLARLIVPVIVVSGDLYSASLGTSGKLIVKPIKQAHVYWNGNVDPASHCRIQILTESAVKSYFTDQMADLKRLHTFLEPHAEAVCSDPDNTLSLLMRPSFWEQAVDPNSDLHHRLRLVREAPSLGSLYVAAQTNEKTADSTNGGTSL